MYAGRRESPWSMVVTNRTYDFPPKESPKDLSVRLVEKDSQIVELNWLPPKLTSGHPTGYIIMYTKDQSKKDREWSAKAVKGDKHSLVLNDLQPSTEYFFKIQARNDRGNGPFTPVISFRTGNSM